jgi:hypothetical protein
MAGSQIGDPDQPRAAWPFDAFRGAVARAEACARDAPDDRAQQERAADEIRRALVQVQRCCRDAAREAERVLALLARCPATHPNHGEDQS